MQAVLKLDRVSKVYRNNVIALDNVSLCFTRGEVFVLLGKNGAGKTTTLKLLTGIIKPTNGDIYAYGENIWKRNSQKARAYNTDIGYQPETPYIINKLTAREYLVFIGSLYGMNKKESMEIIEYYLDFFELNTSNNGYIDTYSFGMQKKIAIIAALLNSSKVLILDEPTGGLDPQSAFKVKELIAEYKSSNRTVIISTHILDMAEKIASRVGILENGKLVYCENHEQGAKRPNQTVNTLEDIYMSVVNGE